MKWQSTFQNKPSGDLDERLVYQGVRSNKMLHRNNGEVPHLHSTEIDSNSVAIISHTSMFWYLQETLQNPANDEKGKSYAGQPYSRACLIWLTINERTLFFASGSAQRGFVTSRVCSKELGLQRKLKYDALKGRGWFFGHGNGAFDSSRWRRSRPSVNATARLRR